MKVRLVAVAYALVATLAAGLAVALRDGRIFSHPAPWLVLDETTAIAASVVLGVAFTAVVVATTRVFVSRFAWAHRLAGELRPFARGLGPTDVLVLAALACSAPPGPISPAQLPGAPIAYAGGGASFTAPAGGTPSWTDEDAAVSYPAGAKLTVSAIASSGGGGGNAALIGGQITACLGDTFKGALGAAGSLKADVKVSVDVKASASGSAGGSAGGKAGQADLH